MRKCKCGYDVANNAKSCPKCGHRFTSVFVKVLALLIVIPIAAIILAVIIAGPSDSSTSASSPGSSVSPSGNVANDMLMPMSPSQQAANLGVAVEEGCLGKRAFFMGMNLEDHSAFWSVGCNNGKSYLVQIFANSTGSTKVLSCDAYHAMTKMSCFKKM